MCRRVSNFLNLGSVSVFVGYFTTLSVSRLCCVQCRMTHGRWIGKDLEGNGRDLIDVLFWYFSGGTEENHDVPAEIRTEHLLVTSQKHFRCAMPLS
jgi:hypothetical protein